MNRLAIILLLIITTLPIFGANRDRPEIYIQIQYDNRTQVDEISGLCSIDKVDGEFIYAFALPHEVNELNSNNIRFQEIPLPYANIRVSMATTVAAMSNWDLYPTFSVYQQMLSDLATNYPNICQLINIGSSEQGRAIEVLKISDNVTIEEAEPEVYYTSTMHGDETIGWIALLRVAYELCEGYGSDAELTAMVDNMEIYLNPLANPDGTYYGGNDSVNSARRYNSNNIDLNRNFIDAESNTNGDGNLTAIENTHQMNFAVAHNFTMSANIHSGAEVVNYPWDTWSTRHVDDTWYQYVSRNYATSLQNLGPTGYMDDLNNGITNGYDWYTTDGCRQDWMNYFQQCREVTLELSNTKLLNNTDLPAYYNYNRQALLDYLKEVQHGIRGIITDANGNPLEAEVIVSNHDDAQSTVWSQPDHGDYYRPIAAGSYTVTYSCTGYPDQVFNNVTVINGQATYMDIVFGSTVITQEIDLNAGWNLISLNTEGSDMSPVNIFSTIASDIIQVKDLTRTYDPVMPAHFNTLNLLNTDTSYWVNMRAGRTLSVIGTATEEISPIQLTSGWNMLGYKPQDVISPDIALQGIVGDLVQVKNLTETYDPTMPSHFNTLNEMTPGEGYWINVGASTNLVFSSPTRDDYFIRDEPVWDLSVYPNNTATLYIEINAFDAEVDDMIGAFDGDECLGFTSPILVEQQIYCTMLVQIPEDNTDIEFRYYDQSTDTISSFDSIVSVASGEIYNVQLNAPMAFDGDTYPAQTNVSVYPNPFNPENGTCVIESKDGLGSWEIFNMRGQLITVLEGTNHWDGHDQYGKVSPSGLYLIRPVEIRNRKTTKLIIMK